jgi:hypothetical protein
VSCGRDLAEDKVQRLAVVNSLVEYLGFIKRWEVFDKMDSAVHDVSLCCVRAPSVRVKRWDFVCTWPCTVQETGCRYSLYAASG